MAQSEILHSSLPFYNIIHQESNPCYDPSVHGLLSPSSNDDTDLQYSVLLPGHQDYLVDNFLMDFEPCDYVPVLSDALEGLKPETPTGPSPCPSLSSKRVVDAPPASQQSLVLPHEEMEMDAPLGLHHLLKAYGEATENRQTELAKAISNRMAERLSPLGGPCERITFHLSQEFQERDVDYIKQESSKNFWEALKVFYQAFPLGKFTHYVANSAILEAIPFDAKAVHLVDFDLGAGLQWPSLIEALAQRQKPLKLRLTCTMMEDKAKFEAISRHLRDYAVFAGLNLTLEAKSIEDLVVEFIEGNGKGCFEWMAFNCMVGVPQMGRVASRREVLGFLEAAKGILGLMGDSPGNRRGIVTFGDGDACWKLRDSPSFGAFFEGHLEHYQTLLESMEANFPSHLLEARLAMETLFVGPFISSRNWFQRWEDIRAGLDTEPLGLGLNPHKNVQQTLIMEFQEMLRADQLSYEVRRVGEGDNEMILEWRGTPLIRISTWQY